jgi:hypothetical protein
MKGKGRKTMTCDWIKSEPVEGNEVCKATCEEDFTKI